MPIPIISLIMSADIESEMSLLTKSIRKQIDYSTALFV